MTAPLQAEGHSIGRRRLVLAAGAAVLAGTSASVHAATRPAKERKHDAKPRRGARKASPSGSQGSARLGPPYATRADAMAFADDLAYRRDLDPRWVRQAIGQAHLIPLAVKLMTPAPGGVAKDWAAYRARFIEPVRIDAGVRFWQEQASWLEQAEARYGVPPEIIVGILGVETIYGRQMGRFRVIDALATLAFDFPAAHRRAAERTEFFRRELEQYLSQKSRAGEDPAEPLGSYAGAMGMPQFMPSSWARHAVDFDGDGHVDLYGSAADAIGSVASYFQAYGWQSGMPTHFDVDFEAAQTRDQLDELLAPDILPSFSPASMASRGAVLGAQASAHPGQLALIELQNGAAAPSYVAGTANFYTITRYNWSSYYAMAVIELGQAVKTARRERAGKD